MVRSNVVKIIVKAKGVPPISGVDLKADKTEIMEGETVRFYVTAYFAGMLERDVSLSCDICVNDRKVDSKTFTGTAGTYWAYTEFTLKFDKAGEYNVYVDVVIT